MPEPTTLDLLLSWLALWALCMIPVFCMTAIAWWTDRKGIGP